MGRHVLIGLTYQETLEFQRLDSGDKDGAANPNDLRPADEDLRWLELYAKHDSSWKRWVAASRPEQRGKFKILKRMESI